MNSPKDLQDLWNWSTEKTKGTGLVQFRDETANSSSQCPQRGYRGDQGTWGTRSNGPEEGFTVDIRRILIIIRTIKWNRLSRDLCKHIISGFKCRSNSLLDFFLLHITPALKDCFKMCFCFILS